MLKSGLLTLIILGTGELFYLVYGYISPDDLVYRAFYDGLVSTNIGDILTWQVTKTGSADPVFGLIALVSQRMSLDYDTFINIIRAFFIWSICSILLKRANAGLTLALVLTSYYFWGIYLGAYRLMLGLAFYMTALNSFVIMSEERRYKFQGKNSLIWIMLSIGTHFQIAAIELSRIGAIYAERSNLASLRINRKLLIVVIIVLAGAATLSSMVSAIVEAGKYNTLYNTAFKILDFVGRGAFHAETTYAAVLGVGMLIAIARVIEEPQKRRMATYFTMLYAPVVIIDRSRTLFILVLLWQYILLGERRILSTIVLSVLSTYSAIKLVDAIGLLAETGEYFR